MEGFYYDAEIEYIVEMLKDHLYFAVLHTDNPKVLRSSNKIYYFNTDEEFVYMNYYYDFGPLNLSCLYKYCCKLNNYLQSSRGIKRIVHYTSRHPHHRCNAAFLIGSYAVMYLKAQPKDVMRVLNNTGGPFKYVSLKLYSFVFPMFSPNG